jgi:hypothetical protein
MSSASDLVKWLWSHPLMLKSSHTYRISYKNYTLHYIQVVSGLHNSQKHYKIVSDMSFMESDNSAILMWKAQKKEITGILIKYYV